MGVNIGMDIQRLYPLGLLDRLLKDKTTGHNILWATDAYSALGMRYGYDEPLSPALITGGNAGVIQARAQKGQARRDKRTRQHGEVCTPLWVVKKMIDHADEVWFGAPGRLFDGDTPTRRVQFDRENDWQRYVDSRRLEITCGEAPYLATRYDVETGESIPLAQRIGILDRKLRVVGENTGSEADWLYWAMRAFEACYGYELQGDSLLTARVNLLVTFADYYKAQWNKQPAPKLYGKFLNRIVWNVWQMDGLTGTLPCAEESDPRLSLADFTDTGGGEATTPIPPPRCRIYDWRGKKSLEYVSLKERGGKQMMLNVILGNPPYQDETLGQNKGYAPPIYHLFLDSVYDIAEEVEVIHPARFLFNAGSTPKQWNQKMLSDPHLKVLFYEPDASKVFNNTEIKGGIAITYHNIHQDYGPIGIFTAFPALNAILHKVTSNTEFKPLSGIIVTSYAYHFTQKLHDDYPEAANALSKGHAFDLKSNVFERLSAIFLDKKPDDDYTYIRILGRENNERVYKFIRSDYVNKVHNLDKFKIFLPKANGAGKFGEALASPVVAPPQTGATETFLSIGDFDTEEEANQASNYIKTKFVRALLGVLKTTQDITPDKWRYVPLQDFTPASDIDWSQPIPAIDRQLYAKYGLDEQEIAFIESHVKEME